MMSEQRFLILGSRGMLGRNLLEESEKRGVEAIGLDLPEFDVTNRLNCEDTLLTIRPNVVINCAAYTDVNRAEAERQQAFLVNAVGAGHVARACRAAEAHCIYLSTDYVFDGTKADPYVEDDPPCPVNAYGASKLAGEHRTMAEALHWTVVRTSWLYGAGGRNFVRAILDQGRRVGSLQVVCDQVGAPTYTRDLAAALLEIALRRLHGIVHITNEGFCSWYEFACAIVELAGLHDVRVCPIASADYPSPARRPANSRLLDTRARARGIAPRPHWRDALARYLEEINQSESNKKNGPEV
ncbi:MAG: dTDP-4-dehydrorhamnose reductase [Candidatus Sumerlaeaceae bacterium]|nr:dTDP-4-dehydrorhamnose reductase [Candidatus Sumerlaeaceae bacterium]